VAGHKLSGTRGKPPRDRLPQARRTWGRCDLSTETLAQLKRALQNASRECAEIVESDRSAWGSRSGAAFILAARAWKYSGFTQFDL
jgi:hypothetical protein